MGSSTLARLTRRFLALSVAAGVVTGLVLPGTATAAQIALDPGDVTFEQWSRDNTPGWTTGNVGKNYTEGEVIPFRLTVSKAENTPAGDSFAFSICRDFEEPAAPASVERNGYLRIEPYDTTVATALEGAIEGNTLNGVTGAGEGATVQILSASDDTDPATGDCDPGQRETEVEFTISGLEGSDKAYVLWGGRLASPFDSEVAPRDGAGAYAGSSLHMTFFPSKTLSANAAQIADAPPPPPPPAPATLTVVKHVVNDDGGTLEAADFTMNVDGTDVSDASFPGSEAGTTVTLGAGTYAVTEDGPAGYIGSSSSGCSGTLAIGQNVICTITNDDVAVSNPGGDGDPEDNPAGGDDDPEDNPGGDDDPEDNPGDGDDPEDNPGGGGDPEDNPGGDDDPEGNPGDGDDPEDNPADDDSGDPGTGNPTTEPEVDSASQTNNPPAQPVQTEQAPVSTLPATESSPTPGPQTAPTLTAELPRTGAGIREQSLLALALLAGGLLSSALGRRRTRPRAV